MVNKSSGLHLSLVSSSEPKGSTPARLSSLLFEERDSFISQVKKLLPLFVYALNGNSYILDAKTIQEKLFPVRYGSYDIARYQMESVIPFLEKNDYLDSSGYRVIFYPSSQSDFIEAEGKILFKNIGQLLSVQLPVGEDLFLMNILISYEWNIEDENSLISIKPEVFKNGKSMISFDFLSQEKEVGQLVDNAVPKLLSLANIALNQFAMSHEDGLGEVSYVTSAF